MPLLELRGVGAHYRGAHVLHDVSLEVGEGELVALLGANGAGKTTTLRLVSGLVAGSGEVRFGGDPLARRSPEGMARLGVAHVPQGRAIFEELSVLDNLRLGGYTRPVREFAAGYRRVVERFGWIEERTQQRAGALSGGQQGMLALARALMQRPRLLMLDEPSLGLAPVVVGELFRLLEELRVQEGLGVLLVEQNARLALAAAARGYVLRDGRVVLAGPAGELARHESLRQAYLGR